MYLLLPIVALQGAFAEHLAILSRIARPPTVPTKKYKLSTVAVKTPAELEQCDALIIPGGESTTIGLLARLSGLLEPLRTFCKDERKAVWGTCAGAILLSEGGVEGMPTAKKGEPKEQDIFGGVKGLKVERNGWGSQVESFESALYIEPSLGGSTFSEPARPFRAVFIRAPLILSFAPPFDGSQPTKSQALADETEVLARLQSDLLPKHLYVEDDPTYPTDDRTIAACRQGRKLVTTFHPELTNDWRFHEYFLRECVLHSRCL
jgi:pyridoxal 5'-phosphate synthase pdxT subunit